MGVCQGWGPRRGAVALRGTPGRAAALASVLSRLGEGRGGLALVTGGAGIGKSRLVAAALER